MTLVSPQDVGRGGFLLSLSFFFLSTLGRVKYPYLWWQRGSGSPHWSRVKPDQYQQGKIRGVSLTLPVKILHEEIRAKQYPPKQKNHLKNYSGLDTLFPSGLFLLGFTLKP